MCHLYALATMQFLILSIQLAKLALCCGSELWTWRASTLACKNILLRTPFFGRFDFLQSSYKHTHTSPNISSVNFNVISVGVKLIIIYIYISLEALLTCARFFFFFISLLHHVILDRLIYQRQIGVLSHTHTQKISNLSFIGVFDVANKYFL